MLYYQYLLHQFDIIILTFMTKYWFPLMLFSFYVGSCAISRCEYSSRCLQFVVVVCSDPDCFLVLSVMANRREIGTDLYQINVDVPELKIDK